MAEHKPNAAKNAGTAKIPERLVDEQGTYKLHDPACNPSFQIKSGMLPEHEKRATKFAYLRRTAKDSGALILASLHLVRAFIIGGLANSVPKPIPYTGKKLHT
ncbi:MAG: hypothetical protein H6575_16400 [Lewinellaceae bacterium]|nr:hypothetical protein [Saprospiraceae bacterium]MCB9356147.1 hypothetical protein [Lewinellaceae bacterium]